MYTQSGRKRKIRTLLKRVSVSFGLFLLTLAGCLAFFWHVFFSPLHVISPLALVQATAVHTSDDKIASVKAFCQNAKIACVQVDSISESAVHIVLDSHAEIFLSTEKDLSAQLASLQLTMQQLTIEGKQFKKLDFRFEKPVITL